MNPSLFNPSPEDTDRVLHRFADHEVSFHDIADEFKTTVPALVLWLSRPEIAQRIADLRSAGAERTRTIAALYLPRTIPVLMRIIDSHDDDIGHRLDDPRDPATPILKLRERESVRKAITLIYRLANFTGTPAIARAASSSAASSPVASTSSRCRETSESPALRAIEVAVLGDFDVGSDSSNTHHTEGVVVSSPGWSEATAEASVGGDPDPVGVVVASGFASTVDSGPTIHESLITDRPSPITPHALEPFVPRSTPSSSDSSLPSVLSACPPRPPWTAVPLPRRSRAGPIPQVA